MKRLSARLVATLVASLVVAASHVRADYLNWSYTSDPNVPGVAAGGAGSLSSAVALTDFTNKPGGTSIPVIAYVTASSSASLATFNPKSSTYTLALTITDNATHDSGTLTFTGSVGGTLSATSSTLTNSFSNPTPPALTLDGHVYNVTIPAAALAPPTSPQQNIFATVHVSDVTGNGGGGVPGVPEPAGLVLGGLGISLLGMGRWWKRLCRPARPGERMA
jgi:hypothetical protein